MEKITLIKENDFEYIKSTSNYFVVIKLKNLDKSFEEYEKEFEDDDFEKEFLKRSGVYFLEEDEGFYIGETLNFYSRFNNHKDTKKLKTISFATTFSKVNSLDKTQIGDIEYILINYAKVHGFKLKKTLKNIKEEKQKTTNKRDHKENENISKYIFEQFMILNFSNAMKTLIKKEKIQTSNYSKNHKKEKSIMDSTNYELLKSSKKVIKMSRKFYGINLKILTNVIEAPKTKKEYKFGYVYSGLALKEFLFLYLFEGYGGSKCEKIIFGEDHGGWISSRTLNYLNIESDRINLGILKKNNSKNDAIEKIEKFVNLLE